MKSWLMFSGVCLAVVEVGAREAEAQLQVVVADGDVTPLGTVTVPQRPSIDDDGAVAFVATVDDGGGAESAALIWRAGTLTALAREGDAAPCGGGSVLAIGNGLGAVESAPVRGLWIVFDIMDSNGVHRRIGSNNGAKVCLASEGDAAGGSALGTFPPRPVTNLGGEVLVDDGRLFLVPYQGGSFMQVAGTGATVPVPPMHTAGSAIDWQLDDDGDVTAVIRTTRSGTMYNHAVHGRPGALLLIVPDGIGANDQWNIDANGAWNIGVNRDGIIAYQATVEPEAASSYTGVWTGAPGATTKAFEYPLAAGAVTLLDMVGRPHVVGGQHFVALMTADVSGTTRRALVRWNAGTTSVIATTGAPLPGHPALMVDEIGGVGVDATGTVYFEVRTGFAAGGVYRAPVAGAVEKIAATGDTLMIAGVAETIDQAYFTTSFGTGYGTQVSPTGRIVFAAAYQGFTREALVTLGSAPEPPQPLPDLVLEVTRTGGIASPNGRFWQVEAVVTNIGEGAATHVVLRSSPLPLQCVPGELDVNGDCALGRIEPGASIAVEVVLDASRDSELTIEAVATEQGDADLTNNLYRGEIRLPEDGGGCLSATGPGASPLPLVGIVVLLVRRRTRRARQRT